MSNSADNRTAEMRPGRAAPIVVLLLAAALAAGAFLWWRSVRDATTMHERAGLQLGTFIQLRAAGRKAPAALDAAMAEIDRLEALFSYNLAGSDVGRLNAAAGSGRVSVDPQTMAVLAAARQMAELSDGSFDPTIGPLVDIWGFRPYSEQQTVPDAADIAAILDLVDYRKLVLYPESNEAELLSPGMSVDLGSIAKGYVVDRVAQILCDGGVVSAVLDIGGNIYALGLNQEGTSWRVGLQHPRQTDQLLGVIPLTDHSVATSGDYQRYFEAGGERYHHLLDPKTGYPADGIVSISIVAATGMQADAVSTAAFVLGPEAGLVLVRQLGLEAVMYTDDGQVQVTGGLQALFEGPS